ncbi:unnamed protein product [Cuscuta campestris]|uniref:Uncharacterized protein n=1 Tax=Cuscuta campestris TaxID=132261 RepID=A0A484NJI9_9ASTE|nr:unnamed protein product [Cuscuta campestris]
MLLSFVILPFPYFQENLIRDDSKLVLLAFLSDSLEFVADFVEGPCGQWNNFEREQSKRDCGWSHLAKSGRHIFKGCRVPKFA